MVETIVAALIPLSLILGIPILVWIICRDDKMN